MVVVAVCPRFWEWLILTSPLWFVLSDGKACTYYFRTPDGVSAI